jgi:sialidase-1
MRRLNRRWFTAGMGAFAMSRARAAPRAIVEHSAVISRQPELYHGWPTVALRRDGSLALVYSGGREAHVCPFGRVELMRSSDGGRTWSWPQVLMDSPIDDRDAGILETTSGTLLVTTFTSLAYQRALDGAKNWPPDRVERWNAVNLRASRKEREALLGCWMLRSTDGGMTWSAPYRVPVNSPHGPIAVSGGRLLYAGKQLWEPQKRVGVAESTDDGKTWRWLADIPARPGDSAEAYHELHAVETADGRLIVHIRNHNKTNAGETLQSESTDGGRTWTEPRPIGVWGLPSHLLRLRDGRLLMSYGYRRAPFGNQARLSSDDGRTWSEPVVISDDGAGGDLGYPSTVELPGGELLTVWYERLKIAPQAVLRMARWRLA